MKRSPLKPGKPLLRKTPMPRASKPMKAIGARGKRMRQGKVAANALEQAWMDAAAAFGCIVCWLHYQVKADAEIHHFKQGDRRLGHLFSIGLCKPHHRGGNGAGLFISRHPWKARFELAYGSEAWLLDQLQKALAGAAHSSPMLPDILTA